MELPIILGIIALTLGVLIHGAILLGVSKLFKIQNATYKKSLIIMLATWAASIVAGIIFGIINGIIDLGLLSSILVTVATFLVSCYLFKKYYSADWKKTLGVYIVFGIAGIVAAFIIVIPLRLFVIEPFTIVGYAMSPTYESGDYVLANKLSRSYDRGDIVVYSNPDIGPVIIRRIVGLPGEKVEVKDGKVYVNGEYMLEEEYIAGTTVINPEVELGENEYLVLGDKRGSESELESLEPIQTSYIIGKIFFRIPTKDPAVRYHNPNIPPGFRFTTWEEELPEEFFIAAFEEKIPQEFPITYTKISPKGDETWYCDDLRREAEIVEYYYSYPGSGFTGGGFRTAIVCGDEYIINSYGPGPGVYGPFKLE